MELNQAMSSLFIVLLTLFLLGICGFVILLILMQRPSEESGMGATLGGGAVTSVFGGEAVNTLAKATRYCVIIFFSLSLILALLYMSLEKTVKAKNLLEAKPALEQVTTESENTEAELGETFNLSDTFIDDEIDEEAEALDFGEDLESDKEVEALDFSEDNIGEETELSASEAPVLKVEQLYLKDDENLED